uniref:Mitochondrial carrier protein n=1 Tax=Guillardia theta TaxID=55529 RepID=A0A7S4P3Q2_GUITH
MARCVRFGILCLTWLIFLLPINQALPHSFEAAGSTKKKIPVHLRSQMKHAVVTKRAHSFGLVEYSSLALVGAISGGLAGAVTDMVMYPIEMIKTRMQTVGLDGLTLDKPSESLQVLFAGSSLALLCSPIYYGLYFAVYEPCKEFVEQRAGKENESLATLIACLLGTFSMFFVRVPCEVVKTRCMTGFDESPRAAVSRLYGKEGVRGFFTGYWGLALVEFPFNVVEMMLYERLRSLWTRRVSRGKELHVWETCIVAAVADGIASAITNPFDVIKARLMSQAGEEQRKYGGGAVGALLQLISEEGYHGLMAGCLARVLWMTVGGVIFWLVLEESQKVMRRLGPRDPSSSPLSF